jgi:hypothetical protein
MDFEVECKIDAASCPHLEEFDDHMMKFIKESIGIF